MRSYMVGTVAELDRKNLMHCLAFTAFEAMITFETEMGGVGISGFLGDEETLSGDRMITRLS